MSSITDEDANTQLLNHSRFKTSLSSSSSSDKLNNDAEQLLTATVNNESNHLEKKKSIDSITNRSTALHSHHRKQCSIGAESIISNTSCGSSSSPKRISQPIEIICVEQNHPTAGEYSDDDDESYQEAVEEFPYPPLSSNIVAPCSSTSADHFPSLMAMVGNSRQQQYSDSSSMHDMPMASDGRRHVHYRPKTTTTATIRNNANHRSSNSVVEEVDPLAAFTYDVYDEDELEIELNEEDVVCFPGLESAKKGTRTIVKKFWEARWKKQQFDVLPEWLQDNEYLRTGHRPPLASFGACFKSIFSLHTETGNIWSHMYGCVVFIGVAAWFLTRPSHQVHWQDKCVFSFFFAGAIACLGMSFAFHTVQCHSISVGKLFSKLDYTGITLLIVGSFIPWIYYGFYCRFLPKIIYISMICVLGIAAVIVSLWDKFSTPRYRQLRAGIFAAMGLSGVLPAFHLLLTEGFRLIFEETSMHWLILMAFLYLFGAALYATRTPERFFPGKCDIWFQSHQLFHTCVIVAALVHYHGITLLATVRLSAGSCSEQMYLRYGTVDYQEFSMKNAIQSTWNSIG